MSLLQEIRNATIKADSNLGEVLRKCKVLAASLDSTPLADWVTSECNGYPENVEPPDYRKWKILWRGTFQGPFEIIRNKSIPEILIPESFRDSVTIYRCRESISVLESYLHDKKSNSMRVLRNSLSHVLGDKVYQDLTCVEVEGEFPKSNFAEVINSVRNRLLDFVLALEKLNPAAGEIPSGNPNASKEVTQIFYNTINGQANIGTFSDQNQNALGNLAMRDSYNSVQTGAMGPNAHAQDMIFQQIWSSHADKLELAKIAIELQKVLSEMKARATTPEDQIAVGFVSAAEVAAKEGDGPKMLKYLKSAGDVCLDIAKQVAAQLVVMAITAGT